MRVFLQFVMRSQQHALLVAIAFAFLPFFSWVSSVIVALVTLRMGLVSGLYLTLWLCLPNIVLAWVNYPTELLSFSLGMVVFVLTWAAAGILRLTMSWSRVLLSLTAVTALVLVIVHLLVPDLPAWWLAQFGAILQQLNSSGSLPIAEREQLAAIQPVALKATGLMALGALASILSNLAIARWGQALLYNPGGFRQELSKLSLDKVSALGLMALTLGLLPMPSSLAQDLALVLLLPLCVVGIIDLHTILAAKPYGSWWLVIFYLIVVLIFTRIGIIGAILLAGVALIDSLFDIKNRLKEGV